MPRGDSGTELVWVGVLILMTLLGSCYLALGDSGVHRLCQSCLCHQQPVIRGALPCPPQCQGRAGGERGACGHHSAPARDDAGRPYAR